MDIEPGISKGIMIVSWSVPVVLVVICGVVIGVYGDPNAEKGFARDVMTYAGSFLSIVGALAVFASDKIMTHWKLHPNPLIYWKMVADFLLAVVAMSSQASNHDDYKNNNDSVYDCNPQVGAWMQFCMLSSETWFFIMALDLFFSLRNPFTSYKNKYPRYHIVAWGLGFISACVLLNEGLTGTSTADICWVKDEEDEDVWVRNRNAILFLYMWMIVYFLASIFVFAIAICRINGGLRTTYMSRRHVLTRTSKILAIFMLYWFVMGCLYYFGLVTPENEVNKNDQNDVEMATKNNAATALIWALLPGKGFVTAIVWFTVNSLPSFIYHSCTKEGREILRRKKLHFVGGDFSPQLNKEVLHFTTRGIIEAVSRNPNRPPANWGMNVLVKKEEVRQFDIELEDSELTEQQRETQGVKSDALLSTTVIEEKDLPLPLKPNPNCPSWCQTRIETTRRVMFRDYCPHVFARIRAAFGVEPASYIRSLKHTAKEKLSAGASGAFMFFTKDGKYIVKSTTPQELQCLLRVLVPYAEYLINEKNKGSFLTRFYGCHSIRMYGRDYSFVVMANIFNTSKVINQSYDIKGSWVSRNADPIVKGKKVRCRHCNKAYMYNVQGNNPGDVDVELCTERVTGCEPNVVLKDNDLNDKIRLEPKDSEKTIEQLVADSELLGSLGIMDYSLIMGVCNTEYEIQDHKMSTRWPGRSGGGGRRKSTHGGPKVKKRQSDQDRGDQRSSRFNSNMSSTSENDREESVRGDGSESGVGEDGSTSKRYSRYGSEVGPSEGEFMMRSRCVVGPEFVFMGLIDMLQEWNMKKRLERFAKILFKRDDGEGLSAIEPNAYMKRFQMKCRAIFEVDTNNWRDEHEQHDIGNIVIDVESGGGGATGGGDGGGAWGGERE
ncbi:hypothetical protein TL16_g06815 [Triparma laevis f. inornata]|uniref:PIPK domain-containing protein n=1 Tax=Triparma laevis f. inornata TaxID=1714386 RepID=A0A9W7EE73_9STRA|nr:hypothetical protein TL16_g06815 [Triparma laevis f. inornata]